MRDMEHTSKETLVGFKPFDEKANSGEDGVLCYVVRRRFRDEGEPVLILHEAQVDATGGAFSYGGGRTWTAEPVEYKGNLSELTT